MVNKIAKQLNIFVQEVPTTTNTFVAKVKAIANTNIYIKHYNAREQILKC